MNANGRGTVENGVISSRALERAVLKRRLEEAAARVLGRGTEFVRLRGGGHWDDGAEPVLPGAPPGAVRVLTLEEYLAELAPGADAAALRQLERVLRSSLSRPRVYRAGSVAWVLGYSPVAGRAGLRIAPA
jgi:hypothetical protein